MTDQSVAPGDRVTVLFVCVHNAGRSQMAAGFLRHIAGDRVNVRSAGTLPADDINPVVVQAMAEVGIDVARVHPQVLDPEEVMISDLVITMGCGDACPVFPGVRYVDWDLPDPSGRPIEEVRDIRDEIDRRVRRLVDQLA
jgi:protein-tyrosine-phosphatase